MTAEFLAVRRRPAEEIFAWLSIFPTPLSSLYWVHALSKQADGQASKETQEPNAGTTVMSSCLSWWSIGLREIVCHIYTIKMSVFGGWRNGLSVKSSTAENPLDSQNPYGGQGSQLPIIPTPGYSLPSSGLQEHTHSHAPTHTETHS